MERLVARIAVLVPPPFAGLASPARQALAAEFLRFGTVGLAGFCVDTAIVYALRARLGLYGAGMVSFLFAATVTWALNRAWTFRGRGAGGKRHHQWARFVVVNLAGFVLNRGTYAALIALLPLARAFPVLAIIAGTAAGMFVNFGFSRRFVFR